MEMQRRRSILPKLLADASDSSPAANENGDEELGEESLNLSSSRELPESCNQPLTDFMIVEDDDLAPLERARRRKSMIVGLHS
jgi:hypothetical protein